MIYLLGIDHQVQHRKAIQTSKAFALYLSKQVTDLNIRFIGEEWSLDLLKENGVETTVSQDVANKYKIEHMFCDPNSEERKNIGYLSKNDNHLREKFWLERIKERIDVNIIFICGADHLGSFNKLLADSGFSSQILSKQFDIIHI